VPTPLRWPPRLRFPAHDPPFLTYVTACRIISGMTKTRLIAATAVKLAARPAGVTANDLASAAGCSLRAAQRGLQALNREHVLTRTVPIRSGRAKGDWRITYHTRTGKG
jgi:hypothetical protein